MLSSLRLPARQVRLFSTALAALVLSAGLAAQAGPDQPLPPLRMDAPTANDATSPPTSAERSGPAAAETGDNTNRPGARSGASGESVLVGPAELYSIPAGKSLILRFQASDDVSGVDDVYVQVNNGPFTRSASRQLDLKDDGFYLIRWYSVDRVGNRSVQQTRAIRIDSTPPAVRFALAGSALVQGNVVGANAVFSLSADDHGGVGVSVLEWRKSETDAWQAYAAPIRLRDIAVDNAGVLQFRALDRLKNESAVGLFHFRVDTNPPVLPRLFSDETQPIRVNGRGVRIPAVEDGAHIEYRFGQDSFAQITAGELLRFPREGRQTLTLRVSDPAGNVQEKTYEIEADFSAPQTELRTES